MLVIVLSQEAFLSAKREDLRWEILNTKDRGAGLVELSQFKKSNGYKPFLMQLAKETSVSYAQRNVPTASVQSKRHTFI